MGGFLLRKVGAALIVLLLASMLVFAGVRAIPGDPAVALGAENRDPAVLKAIRHKYGLDKPLPVQYLHWLGYALRGDLGTDQRELSVSRTIVQRLRSNFSVYAETTAPGFVRLGDQAVPCAATGAVENSAVAQ